MPLLRYDGTRWQRVDGLGTVPVRYPGTQLYASTAGAAFAAGGGQVVSYTGTVDAANTDTTMWTAAAPSVVNIPLSGRYEVSGVVQFLTTNATGLRQIVLRRNGTTIHVVNMAPTTGITSVPFALSDCVFLLGDVFDINAAHTATASLTIGGSGVTYTRLGITYQGPLN